MKVLNLVLLFVICLAHSIAFASFDPAATFEKKCSSCHTVGGGVLKGPDLKDVTKRRDLAWLLKFIPSPERAIKSGDTIAVQLYNEFGKKDMPEPGLSQDEIKELLKFIESGAVTALSVNIKSALKATKEDIEKGKEIFLGIRHLKNGGPSCVSCHSIHEFGALGGGTLAKNLSHIYSDYKDNGMSIALTKLAFPIMSEVFASKKLTDEEIFYIKSFFYTTDQEELQDNDFQTRFLLLGICLVIILLIIVDSLWRKRRKESIRKLEGGLR